MRNLLYNIYRRIVRKSKKFKYHDRKPDYYTDFKTLDGWDKGLWWGSYAVDEKTAYWDNDEVLLTDNLKLRTSYKPLKNVHNGEIMHYTRSAIQGKTKYKSGAIEVIVNMKPACNIWFAPLWFVEAEKVLPEIDVAEVYTKDNPCKAEAKTNIHYGTDYEENSKNIGSKTHYIPNIFNRDVSFGIIWNKKFIKIYYDGYLVRHITNKNILKRIENGMYPIINVAVQNNAFHYNSEMIVKSFKYWNV